MARILFALGLAGALVSAPSVRGAAPAYVPVQGVLTDAAGMPMQGDVTATFSLYGEQSGGGALWSEVQTVTVNRGLFHVYLGEVQSLDLTLFRDHGQLWFGIQVEGDSEMPRMRLGSNPYAGYAEHAPGAIPSGFCMFSLAAASCPAGWSAGASFAGRTLHIVAADPGGTGGAAVHGHAAGSLAANHTHTFSDTVSAATEVSGGHSHAVVSHNHSLQDHFHSVAMHSHVAPSHAHSLNSHGHTTADHTLTVTEMPSHTHTFTRYLEVDRTAGAGSGIWRGLELHETTATGGDGAHNHGATGAAAGSTGDAGPAAVSDTGPLVSSGPSWSVTGDATPGTSAVADHSHALSDSTAAGTTSGPSATAVSGTSADASSWPPYVEVIVCCKD